MTTTSATAPWVPTGRPRLVDPESFVFWVAVVATAYSTVGLFHQIAAIPTLQVLPAVGWLALVVWTAYAAVFLAILFHYQLFVRRAPMIIVAALLWGGVTAVFFAGKANAALEDILVHWFGIETSKEWITAFAAATNEESLKLLGVAVLFLLPRARLRGPIDGLYFGALVGLGFQVVEDFLYTVQEAASLTDVFGFLMLRGVLTGLFAHAAFTAVTGAGLGYCATRTDAAWPARIGVAVGSFVLVWAIHLFWDAPVLQEPFGDGGGAYLAALLLRGLPIVLSVLVALHLARGVERREWNEFVERAITDEVITSTEAAALQTRRARRDARRSAHHTSGRSGAKACELLQREQLRYVQAVREEGAASEAADRLAGRIADLRLRLS